jgi:hypothetical protein
LQRCDIIYTHQAAVAHDISRKNSRQSPFDMWAGQDALNSGIQGSLLKHARRVRT